jgi:ribonuclease P protein component
VDGRFGLPKRRRLRKRPDFLRVQEGKSARVTTPHFVLLIAGQPVTGAARLGIVASKKVGGAVARNRAKRLLREMFRTTSFPAGIDLVVIVRPGAPALSFAAVGREIEAVSATIARRAREVVRK